MLVCYVARRDEEGAVITGPRNFTTRPLRKGKDEGVYLARTSSYLCRGDTYQNPKNQQLRTEVKDGYKLIGK